MSLSITGKTVFGQRPASLIEWDTDFLAFWARTTGTPDSWKSAYNHAFLNLKSRGLFSIADCFWLWCGHNDLDSRLNLIKNAHNGMSYNSPIFMAKNGQSGNGVSAYIDLQYNPAAAAEKFSLDNATFYVYRKTRHINENAAEMSCYASVPMSEIFDYGASTVVAAINGGASFAGQANTTTGGIATCRTNSSEILSIRGTSVMSLSNASTGLQNATTFLFKRNEGGGAYFSDSQLSSGFIGGYISGICSLLDEVTEVFLAEIAAL